MDNTLINNWCEVVRPDDHVYVLGDFAWKLWYYHNILPALPGKIFLIPGNHDEKVLNVARRHVEVVDRITLLKIDKKKTITLSHYPLESWYNSAHGTYHLHGHLHGQKHHGDIPKLPRRFDVGVDNYNFYPVTLEQILDGERYEELKANRQAF